MKVTRRFDFDFKPLIPSQSITATDSVPDRQTYDAATGVHTPDYTLTPLTVRANISVLDPDGITASGDVNRLLSNIRWYEIQGGVESIIATSDTRYSIGAEGSADAGQIQVMRNIDPSMPLTLVFRAEYIDPRTSQVFRFSLTKLVRCTSETSVPTLELSSPPQVIYNPIRHAALQPIKASLTLAAAEVPQAHRKFIWQVLRADGSWSEAGNATDGILDYDIEVSADGSQATVDRSLMGYGITIRCLALYDPSGNPSAMAVDNNTPVRTVRLVRRIPEFWPEMLDAPYNIPRTPYIFPRAQVRDNMAILTDAEAGEHFSFLWYMATNKPGGATLTYTKIGEGIRPQLPTSLMSQAIGGVLALDAQPREPWAAWQDSDGSIITDSDGSILLIR